MHLPIVLAGPILRRTEPGRVCVWVATSERADVDLEIGIADAKDAGPLGSARAHSIKLGPRLYIHLASAKPGDGGFPTGRLLDYDVTVTTDQGRKRLRDLGLIDPPNAIVYPGFARPTFFIPSEDDDLKVIHGSCRLLHGKGEDALAGVDAEIERTVRDPEKRPQALFLTGDQIYADDVASPMLVHVRPLADELLGEADDSSVPGVASLSALGVDGRADVVESAGFTSTHPDNHLMSFGEFAAMYVCAWNVENWPPIFDQPEDDSSRSFGSSGMKGLSKFARQVDNLERARAALPAVRRALANIPTYMIFDDHDVTDDWNINRKWHETVSTSPTGRRIVANALATFWAFQGWGNDPSNFDSAFIETVTGGLDDAGPRTEFEKALWDFDAWSYHAPTHPPTIVMDTRTQRSFDSDEGAARLVSRDALKRVVALASGAGHEPGQPLVLVSAVPIFGFEMQERRQKFLVGKVGPYEIDFEAWHSNLSGLVDLMKTVVDDLAPSCCIVLSGDVHYGVSAEAAFKVGDAKVPMLQLVSSGQKHAGVLAKWGLKALGEVLLRRHTRLGWEESPNCTRFDAWSDRFLLRAVNTDEWSPGTPVFLAPRDAKLLGIDDAPDFWECRVYVRPQERMSSILAGENNVGVVTFSDGKVGHCVVSRNERRSKPATAVLEPGRI
jgi:hypothetical protein